MVSKRARFSAWSPVPHLGPYSSLERFPTQTPDNATHNQPNPQSPSHGRSFSLTGSSGRCCLVATFSRLVERDRSVLSSFDLLTSSPWSLSLLICAIQSPTARLCLSGSTWEPSHWVWLSPGPSGNASPSQKFEGDQALPWECKKACHPITSSVLHSI